MKLKPALTLSLLAFAAAFSLNAAAASDSPADVKPDAQKEQAATTKNIKPHSHAEEKYGVASKAQDAASEAKPGKPKKVINKSNHFHPRDGK
jgi:hypothetical protein